MEALLRGIRRLLSKEQRRFIKFCLVGASGVPVNLLFTWLGNRVLFAGWGEEGRTAAACLLGILVSIFTNFLWNDLWTWRDRRQSNSRFVGRLLRFYLVCSAASLIQFGTAMALRFWLRQHYLLAQLGGIALATAVNFVINNAWTFRKHPAGVEGAAATAATAATPATPATAATPTTPDAGDEPGPPAPMAATSGDLDGR